MEGVGTDRFMHCKLHGAVTKARMIGQKEERKIVIL
jgi:hypothetical protein